MSLRDAFAAALQYMRKHRNLSQRDISAGTDQSHVSRLEAAGNSVSLEVSDELARALAIEPMALLALVYASQNGVSPKCVLSRAEAELEALELLHVHLPSTPSKLESPRAMESAQRSRAIAELLAQGKTQAEVARLLGLAKSTVTRHVQLINRAPSSPQA